MMVALRSSESDSDSSQPLIVTHLESSKDLTGSAQLAEVERQNTVRCALPAALRPEKRSVPGVFLRISGESALGTLERRGAAFSWPRLAVLSRASLVQAGQPCWRILSSLVHAQAGFSGAGG